MTSYRRDARARVFAVLAASGAVSRAELARRAGLAPSTVSATVAELDRDGLLVEPADTVTPRIQALSEATALGRPPVLVALHRRAGVVVGIDFGKRHVRVAVADLAHAVLAERHRVLDRDLPAGDAVSLAGGLVDEVLEDAGAVGDDVLGVGMGLPGPVHLPSGELGDSTILPGWVGIRAGDAMSERLGRPVEVANDANLGALSELMWGAGQGVDHLAYVKVATGVGAGLIIGGRPYLGVGGTAGELGHTVIDPGGSICRCGNRGCLETVAGADALRRSLGGTRGEDVSVAEVVQAALAGDPGCRRAVEDAGAAVGIAVSTLCNLFNPGRIVVGGDLALAGEVLLEPMRSSMRRGAIRSAADDTEVVLGTLGERAEVLGAVGLVLRRGSDLANHPRAGQVGGTLG